MPRPKNPWAEELSTSLKRWCQENGYKSVTMLGRELGAPETVWPSIRTGYAITTDTTIYARLFLKGISQADPRKIPPRLFKDKGGKIKKEERAWTEEQWQTWLAQQQDGELLAPGAEKAVETVKAAGKGETETLPPQESPTIGGIIDTFISLLGSQIGKAVAPYISQAILDATSRVDIEGVVHKALAEHFRASKPSSTGVNTNLRQIANELFKALEPYIYGTSGDRNHLQKTYGDVLQKLGPALGILSDREPEREKNLPIWLASYEAAQKTRRQKGGNNHNHR